MLQNFRTFNLSVDFYQECEKIKLPRHLKDQRKFFQISLGSLRECQAVLILAGFSRGSKVYELSDMIGAYLYKLIKSKKGPH